MSQPLTDHEVEVLRVFNELAAALRNLDDTANAHAKALERVNTADAQLRFLARGGSLSLSAGGKTK